MKPLFLLLGIGAIVALTQGCAHGERAATADSKVVVTIEGESQHVGRVLAALPVHAAPSEAPRHEAGTSSGDDVSRRDHDDDDEWSDDEWSDDGDDASDDDASGGDMSDDADDDSGDDDSGCDGHSSDGSFTARGGAGRWTDAVRGRSRARWD